MKYYKKANKKETKREKVIQANAKRRESGEYRKYLQNNPDKVKKYRLKRNQHKKHEISKSEWEQCKQYFNYECAYCGLPINEHYYTRLDITKLGDFHKEHVNHNGANDLSNCVPSCISCNGKKWTFDFEEWYNINNPIYTIERYNKIIKWLNEDFRQVKTA